MNQLDDVQTMLDLDKSNMQKSIKDLPLQLEQAWKEAIAISLPDDYKDVDNVIIAGMGGSALGPHAVVSLYGKNITKPVHIIHDYHLPGYANERTLVIASSNSGDTEETLSCFEEAYGKKCKVITLTTGGKLAEFSKQYNLPAYIFDQKYNQTGQPRMSTGYMIFSVLAFFKNLGFLEVDEQEVLSAIEAMYIDGRSHGIEIEFDQNPAKQLAQKMHSHIPFLIGAEFLAGTVHTMANQINENAKCLSAWFLISEMNHHLLEGLAYEQHKDDVLFVLIDSDLYAPRIRQRVELSKTIIEKNNFDTAYITIKGKTPLSQSCNLLQFGSYVSYYLAMLHHINPSPIPSVNFLKKELGQ